MFVYDLERIPLLSNEDIISVVVALFPLHIPVKCIGRVLSVLLGACMVISY